MLQFAESGKSCEFDCIVVLVDIDIHLCHMQTCFGLVFVHMWLTSKKECIKHECIDESSKFYKKIKTLKQSPLIIVMPQLNALYRMPYTPFGHDID